MEHAVSLLTITWQDRDAAGPARDVLVRLVALTDRAYEAGDVSAYLMEPGPDRTWAWTGDLPPGLRASPALGGTAPGGAARITRADPAERRLARACIPVTGGIGPPSAAAGDLRRAPAARHRRHRHVRQPRRRRRARAADRGASRVDPRFGAARAVPDHQPHRRR